MGKTDTEQEERVLKPRKDVQIIIHGHAEYNSKDTPVADFDDFVNEIFNQNRDKLIKIFNANNNSLSYKSALKDFHFDSVEKQIR